MIPLDILVDQTSFLYYDVRSNSISTTDGHFHNYYEIYYLKSGKCSFFSNNMLSNLKPGDVVFIPPHSLHKFKYDSAAHERIAMFFSEDFVNAEIKDQISDIWEKRIYHPKDPSFFEEIFEKIKQKSFVKKDVINHTLLKCYITELLCYVASTPPLYIRHDNSTKSINGIDYIIKYISENYSRAITFNTLAEQTGYTPNYLSKLFKDTIGTPYKKYILLMRLSAAENLLSTTDCSVSEISERCGFNDSNYFSYCFKKKLGMSPLKFRTEVKASGRYPDVTITAIENLLRKDIGSEPSEQEEDV